MKQHPLQTAGRVRLPYTRRRSDARCVTSLSRLPDVPENSMIILPDSSG